ncbi:MAG TPA: STAS domain-containing protein [Acidimicrobiales bacterium]|jgi:anti-sigma B factor antagonist|nr:STAS domain-containing protein [Acidimicrobiales bacterium]
MDLGLVVREEGEWTVLAVSGEIDIATAPSLREKLHSLLAEGRLRLIVDLDEVTFLDSTALGVLVGVLKRARTEGGELRIVCNQPRVRKVFEITRLDSAFDLCTTVEDAVKGGIRE